MKASKIASLAVDASYLALGIVVCGFALKGFILPNGFFDGGTSGLSLTIHAFLPIELGYLVLPLNLPFLFLGARIVSWEFAIKTLVGILGLSLCLLVVPYPVITSDRLLVAIFGGVFMGCGVGLAIRGGAALDGLDIFSLYSGRKLPFTPNQIILTMNVLIFLAAAVSFGIETSLYSMLIYFCGSRAADFVAEGIEEYTSVTIVSAKSDEIKRALVLDLGRGITVYKGERGFLPGSFDISHDTDVVFAVITRLEVRNLTNLVRTLDPHAFVVVASAREAAGGVLRRRAAF